MPVKNIYNPDTKETLNDRKVFGGNPDGMINFTRMKYQWALNLWDTMEANTWFPKEVQMTGDAKDYKLLSEPEKRMYDLILSRLIFMDSLQVNNIMDNINPYITAPEINACLSRQSYEEANHCFTEGTQILTSEGFIDFKDLTLDHKVANWHADKSITFEKPTEIINQDYNGPVYEFNGRAYSLEVTPNHRVINYNIRQNNKLEDTFAADIGLNNRNIPINGYKLDGKFSELSFLDKTRIAFQADGTLVNNTENKTINGYCYRFSFKKERKIIEMEHLLNSKNDDLIKFTKTETQDGYTHFYIWLSKPADKDFNWVNLEDYDTNWFSEFIEYLKKWDGSYATGTDAIRYGNTNKKAIDKIIEIATLCGKIVGIEVLDPKTSKKTRIGKNKQVYYNLYIRDAHHKSGRAITKTEKHYSGKIYCCTVPSSMIIVKKDDLVTVSGNSKSYAVMVESISENTDEIYDMWKKDEVLKNGNSFIASIYIDLANSGVTNEKILLALFANQILEGIYFYSGFAAIYALGKSGKMLGSSQMIRFIQRDEVTHLLLFQNMINSVRKERPELFTKELEQKVREMFRKAVELEASWGKYITQGQILGFTDGIIEQYIQYLADKRLEAVGYAKEYNVSHPIPWVDGYASFNNQRTNFFEGNVVNYSKGSIDFDDF